ncbi:acyl dehydratase [Bradyrhizobium sp. USDA 328]
MSDTERAAEAEAIRSKLIALEEYRKLLNGSELTSNWLLVNQSMIDTFADATRDHQFIHVDPMRAKAEAPFEGTIAHGFLTLSLLSTLAFDVMPGVEGDPHGRQLRFRARAFPEPRQIRNTRAREISFNRSDGTRGILAIRVGNRG